MICSAVWRSPLHAQWNPNSLAPNPYEDYRVLPTLPHFQNSSQSQCHHNQLSNMDTDTKKIKCIPKGTRSHIAKLEITPVTVSRVFVFCSVYYSQPIPHPLESLQLCLYHSGVFFPSQLCALYPSDVGMSLITTHLKPLYPLKRLPRAIVWSESCWKLFFTVIATWHILCVSFR